MVNHFLSDLYLFFIYLIYGPLILHIVNIFSQFVPCLSFSLMSLDRQFLSYEFNVVTFIIIFFIVGDFLFHLKFIFCNEDNLYHLIECYFIFYNSIYNQFAFDLRIWFEAEIKFLFPCVYQID